MKFTWGTGILLFLIMFLTACGLFIAFAMSYDLNLVHKDYYQKGADHSAQMRINKQSIKYQTTIYIKSDNKDISIFFPDNFSDNLKSGEIHFFRPSASKKDYKVKLLPTLNRQIISKSKLAKGRYLVKFSWESDKIYFIEKEIQIK